MHTQLLPKYLNEYAGCLNFCFQGASQDNRFGYRYGVQTQIEKSIRS